MSSCYIHNLNKQLKALKYGIQLCVSFGIIWNTLIYVCEFMFRMFYAYKNGESTAYHKDGNKHKMSFEKCGSNFGESICEKIQSQLPAVGKLL